MATCLKCGCDLRQPAVIAEDMQRSQDLARQNPDRRLAALILMRATVRTRLEGVFCMLCAIERRAEQPQADAVN